MTAPGTATTTVSYLYAITDTVRSLGHGFDPVDRR